MPKRRPMLMVVMAGLLVTACGVNAQSSARLANPRTVPFELLDPTAPTLVPNAAGRQSESVSLCFIRDHDLVVVQRLIEVPVLLRDAIGSLAEPPQTTADLRTAFGGETLVNDVQLNAGVVRVDLAPTVASLGGDNQLLAIGQLVCTLTARPGVGQVAFTLAGAPVDVPRADGSLTVNAVARDDYAALIKGGA